jgi:P27 family predicted phage terminase small subunit
MPTPLKTTENIRKHMSKAERVARQTVEITLQHKRVRLPAPDWLSVEARQIFESTKRQLRGLQLLDNVDANLLALYADAVARYQSAVKALKDDSDPKEITAAQSWSRLALSFAEKLGISISARARLAKKAAEQTPPDDLEQLLDDVTDFVNSDVR